VRVRSGERPVGDGADIFGGVVLVRWCISAYHAAYGVQSVTCGVGVQEHEDGAVAVGHALELFEGGVAGGLYFALVLGGGYAYVAGIAVAKSSWCGLCHFLF